jgi:hypothetical protein
MSYPSATELAKIRKVLEAINVNLTAIARSLQPPVNKAENDKHSQE